MSNHSRRPLPLREFTAGANGMSLLGNAVRESLAYDAYEGKTVFNAVVLTTPVILSELDLNYNGPTAGGQGAGGADRVSEFMFKGRILAEDGIPSPHDYLPDPCDGYNLSRPFATADGEGRSQTSAIMNVIALHTTFFSAVQQEVQGATKKPKVGDIVRVELERNVFSYNLATGVYLETITDQAISTRTMNGEEVQENPSSSAASECENLSALMDSLDARCTQNNIDDPSGCFGSGFFVPGTVGGEFSTMRHQSFPNIIGLDQPRACYPTQGTLTSGFGLRMHPIHQEIRMHWGIDIAGSGNPDVVAVAPGVIERVQDIETGYGKNVIIRHHGSDVEGLDRAITGLYTTLYAHMDSLDVVEGQIVERGEKIGTMGQTGGSTGDHLHFEVKFYASPGNVVKGDPVQILGFSKYSVRRGATSTPGELAPRPEFFGMQF